MSALTPTFAEPQWAHAIWPVVAVVGVLLWLDARSSSSLDRFLSPAMQSRLVARPSRQRRRLAIAMMGLCGLFLVLALMRPQWGRHFVKTPRVGAQIMICLDVSKSMLAEDAAPNRLERAKAEIGDLLSYLDDDQVGLIAFAGKATVLCPMTPDFGFYRLVLETAGPGSVARGGTNLEAPIRKALDGFRAGTDVSRAIILITDGEDHDTHPIDAAKAAAERGVRIITIGFGDEGGSKVLVTDPRTGAREPLRDGEGRPVVTRLDGEMLRRIAQETGGAYVPAGTGVLDLKSIYDAHIAGLTRGRLEDQGRLVKREGFQWPLLVSLVCLFAAVLLLGKVAVPSSAVAAVCLLWLVPAARAEDDAVNPRELYNHAVSQFNAGEMDDAEREFLDARQQVSADAKTRFSASYNLGWVEVKRADGVLKEHPEEALEKLQRAADWFREAVRLDPENEPARENMEIISRRILALTDALREKDEKDLAARLDELIDRQRHIAFLIQDTVSQVAELDSANIPDRLRDEFKGLEAEQRDILSQLGQFMLDAQDEVDQLTAIKDEQRTPEQSMRLAQLSNMMYYLHDASQRVGQTRRQLRQRQAERAYRRASSGLDRMKQARDMLRNIVEVLGGLIMDATDMVGKTAKVSEPDKPAWLSHERLKELHEAVKERADVLFARMDAGRQAGEQQPPEDDEQKKLLAQLAQATPVIGEARDAFGEAIEAIDSRREKEAYDADVRAIERLLAARELFLDIRGLIEAMYADQTRMQAAVEDENVPIAEYLPMLKKLQAGNTHRGERLNGMINDQLSALSSTTTAPAQPGQQPEAEKQVSQVYQTARGLLGQVMKTFAETASSLDAQKPEDAVSLIGRGAEEIELLRRLFFSILEHLEETARRQSQLGDDTRNAATLDNVPAEPLATRQQELAGFSQQLAESLKAQSQQGGLPGQGQPADDADASRDAAARLMEAANHVIQAAEAMSDAASKLSADPPGLTEAAEPQQTAVNELIEAIRVLQPPQQQSVQQQQEQAGQQDNEGEQQEQEEQEGQQQQMDMRHVLQAVRDRAAQREQERRREPSGYQPVEKDW